MLRSIYNILCDTDLLRDEYLLKLKTFTIKRGRYNRNNSTLRAIKSTIKSLPSLLNLNKN